MHLSRALFDAAEKGSISVKLQCALKTRTRKELQVIVGTKIRGTTALITACKLGHLVVVRFLIEQCFADIEQKGAVILAGDYSDTAAPPLWCAAASNNIAIVDYLIQKKANVDSTTETTRYSALNVACYEGHYRIAKFLINCLADTELADHKGNTCLMVACLSRHNSIVDLLLDSGADVNRKNMKGMYFYPFSIRLLTGSGIL